jgi:hypothetical protein
MSASPPPAAIPKLRFCEAEVFAGVGVFAGAGVEVAAGDAVGWGETKAVGDGVTTTSAKGAGRLPGTAILGPRLAVRAASVAPEISAIRTSVPTSALGRPVERRDTNPYICRNEVISAPS